MSPNYLSYQYIIYFLSPIQTTNSFSIYTKQFLIHQYLATFSLSKRIQQLFASSSH